MPSTFYPPEHRKEQFHCPWCGVYARQSWQYLFDPFSVHASLPMEVSKCQHCYKYSYWFEENLLIPNQSSAPQPHEDLPEEIAADYSEAASIVNRSPRGATAILRLCLQNLLKHLGESGKNINDDIASLVSKGLPIEVQQALDILRVIGNESVHPGTLDLKDNTETALQLFGLINFIVEDRITRKKKIAELFGSLSEKAREAIVKRDSR